MNLSELRGLADWYGQHFRRLDGMYNSVLEPIRNNANQASKQPFEEQLEALLKYLRAMSFGELSLQQLKLLNELGVASFLGPVGAENVASIIRTSDYDPSTAGDRLDEALTSLRSAQQGFAAYRGALEQLGMNAIDEIDNDKDGLITIRIGFQKKAAISNIVDWKKWAGEWNIIISGISAAANERPQDTKIVGASTGSIILILAGTAAVTTLLAAISKDVTSVAKDVIEVRTKVEELRGMKLLNAKIEAELKGIEEEKVSQANARIIVEVLKQIPDLSAEKKAGLQKSVDKLLDFSEKGGNIDFVAPDEPELTDAEGGEGAGLVADIAKARAAIIAYQDMREEIKLLTDALNGAG